MYSSNEAVCTSHLNTLLSSLDEWLKNLAHGFMKETLTTGLFLVGGQLGPVDFVCR